MNARVTVGILYPGHAAEDDFSTLDSTFQDAEAPPVRLPVAITTIGVDEHTPQALRETGSHPRLLAGAQRLLTQQRVDSLMWACTSGSFVFGWQGAHSQVRRLTEATGVPVSSTSLGFVRALTRLGLRRVAVAASYPAELAEHFVGFLRAGGVEPVAFEAQGVFTAQAVSQLPRAELFAMIRHVDVPAAQAVVVPDTAMHSLTWVEEMEQALGKPVLTANQVTIWEGMRIAGVAQPQLPALGSLLNPERLISSSPD